MSVEQRLRLLEKRGGNRRPRVPDMTDAELIAILRAEPGLEGLAGLAEEAAALGYDCVAAHLAALLGVELGDRPELQARVGGGYEHS